MAQKQIELFEEQLEVLRNSHYPSSSQPSCYFVILFSVNEINEEIYSF